MLEVNKKYKFVTDDSFYTGTVLEQDEHFVKIKDKFDREVIINKKEIKKVY